ncbi:hypothetical protein ACHAWF_012368 [Thalassiosira exigua]
MQSACCSPSKKSNGSHKLKLSPLLQKAPRSNKWIAMSTKGQKFPCILLIFVVVYLFRLDWLNSSILVQFNEVLLNADDGPHFLNNTQSLLPVATKSAGDSNSPKRNFVYQFNRAVKSDDASKVHGGTILPFVLLKGKLMCRRSHKHLLDGRTRPFVEMVQHGIGQFESNQSRIRKEELPILLLKADSNGCDVSKRFDHLTFPRLTWSFPSPKYGSGWCGAIPITTYASWNDFHQRTPLSWSQTFQYQESKYPWSSKVDTAVWRGSTTYDRYQFHGAELDATPRGQLVRKSMQNPSLIDARFSGFVQQYASKNRSLSSQGSLPDFVPSQYMQFDDQMNHKAILDIDGNNWSSRFPSVIVKIDADYVELFYQEFNHELKPMVHYVPASLQNLTRAVAYVVDKHNEDEMKAIVCSANSWCRERMTKDAMAKSTMVQLEHYASAVNKKIQHGSTNISYPIKDLVQCY